MRADADFMVYVDARWHALVRDATGLGCPPAAAPDAVSEALSRCRRDWGRASREENVDRLVQETLREEVRRRSGRGPAAGLPSEEPLTVLAPPTIEELRRRERDRSRRAVRRAAAVGVPLLLVASGAVWASTRGPEPGPDDDLEPAALTRAANPAPGVVWYADGRLHLEHGVLEIEDLTDMTALGSGVVYGDREGRVVHVGDDGTRLLLGRKEPSVPVAATDETGVAAWYDPGSEEVVAVRAATGGEVLRTRVDDRPRVVAVDGDVVYLAGSDGVRALLPTGPTSEASLGPGLLDVRARVQVFQVGDDTLELLRLASGRHFVLPGRGAVLAPDGTTLISRPPGHEDEVLVYDARRGEPLPDGLAPGDRVLASAPGRRATVAYVVHPAGEDGDLELRTCTLGERAACDVVASIPDPSGPAVLAR